jgi:hypothetical protein
MEGAIVLDCPIAEAVPSAATSASCYYHIEYVRILSIVKSELKLAQVEQQVGFANFL